MILKKKNSYEFFFYLTNNANITTIDKNNLYHINNLKSFFLIYFNKNSIHNKPAIKAMKKPMKNIDKLLLINDMFSDFKKVSTTAPKVIGTDK